MPKKKEVPDEPSDCENKKAKTTHAALTWRRDPEETFSDWKIIVTSKSALWLTTRIYSSLLTGLIAL